MINYKKESQKIDVLLYYENAFREDWRFLSRLRLIASGVFIGIISTIIGWFVKLHKDDCNPDSRLYFGVLIIIVTLIAIITMGWFASSLNVLKRFIVSIQESLGLYRDGVFKDGSLLDPKNKNWGLRGRWYWGKAIIATIIVGVIFYLALMYL